MLYRGLIVLPFLLPSLGSANLMTFDAARGVPSGPSEPYTEDGISTAARFVGRGDEDRAVHLDRAGLPGDPWIDFTMGQSFVVESVMIRAGGSAYCLTTCTGTWDDPISYIWFSGFRENALTTSTGVYRPKTTEWELFDLTFLGTIDRLRIEVRNYLDFGLPGSCNGANGCGHFDVDNVLLTPLLAASSKSVPEPATLTLFGAGLLGMLAARRRAK